MSDRHHGTNDREHSMSDRHHGTNDREHSPNDRERQPSDREHCPNDREHQSNDREQHLEYRNYLKLHHKISKQKKPLHLQGATRVYI